MSGTNQNASSGYARLWRWHFLAGVFLSPTLAVLAVTGLVYLFKPQAEPKLYEKWLRVPVGNADVPVQRQWENAQSAFPGWTAQSLIASPGAGRSTQVFLKSKKGPPLTVYINPHDGSVVGSQRTDRTLMQLAHDVHGSLLLGRPGEIVMELTAGWAFLLFTTGLFLWWPKKGGGAGVLYPRWSLPGRGRWRDLHAVPAFYLVGLLFLFVGTGIPWTGVTGKWISQIAQATGTGSPPGFGGSPFSCDPAPGQKPLPLDRLVAIARERLPGATPTILWPQDPRKAAVIRWKAPRPRDRAYIHVNPYTGAVLADYRWKDFGWIGKATLMSVALHEGTWLGTWNLVLNSIVGLGVLALVATGAILWWKRRPAGAWAGAPAASGREPLPAAFWSLLVLFFCFVPMAGASALALFGLDKILKKWRRPDVVPL